MPMLVPKPAYGARLDRSHPWAARLVGFWPCNEGAGPTVRDVSGNGLDLTAMAGYGAANPWGAGPSGIGIAALQAASGFMGPIPPRLRVDFPMSIAVAGRIGGAPTLNAKILGILPVSLNTSPWFVLQFHLTDQATLNIGWTVGGNTVNVAPIGTFPPGADFAAVLVATASSVDAWLDGAKTYSSAVTIAANSWTADSAACLGGFVNGGTACAPTYWGAWWTRRLTAGEAQAISASPSAIWDMCRPAVDDRVLARILMLQRRTLYGRAGSRGVA